MSVIAAVVIGRQLPAPEVTDALARIVPAAEHFEARADGSFVAWKDAERRERLATLRAAEADGYGGPMRVLVALDDGGAVVGAGWVEERETSTILARVRRAGFPEALLGKTARDAFVVGDDVDAVTGATVSLSAVCAATRAAAREVAGVDLGWSIPAASPPRIEIGAPEILLLLLFAVGLFGPLAPPRARKILRGASLTTGLLFLGFLYNDPLTLADVNRLLLGYLPPWRTELGWYLLIGGTLGLALVRGHSPYCHWFCPFGAAQEGLGALGRAQPLPRRRRETYLWIQRGLAWLAILLGLLFANPALSSYEVFGGLFDLVGTAAQFTLLAIVLLAALFVRRPWCRLLCPLRPVTDYLRLVRHWSREAWLKLRRASEEPANESSSSSSR